MAQNLDEGIMENPEIKLTLEPLAAETVPEEKPEVQLSGIRQETAQVTLTPEEQKMVDEFAEKIDLTNTNMVLQYGAGAQKKIADFSETALENIRTKDLGEVGQMLSDLVGELKTMEPEEEKGFLGIFKKSTGKLSAVKAKYEKAESHVNQVCKLLENHQVELLKDVAVMDRMYGLNLSYLKELSM